MKRSLNSKMDNLPWLLTLLTVISWRYKVSIYTDYTATHLGTYDHRKQYFVFCNNVIKTYKQMDLQHKIHILDYADKVNSKLRFPIIIDEGFKACMVGECK